MKKVLILLVLFGLSTSFGQFKKFQSYYGTVPQKWVELKKTDRASILAAWIMYDGGGTDTLWVAWGMDDTLSIRAAVVTANPTLIQSNKLPITLADQGVFWDKLYTDKLWVRSSGNPILVRITLY